VEAAQRDLEEGFRDPLWREVLLVRLAEAWHKDRGRVAFGLERRIFGG
jgi:hypothetical protein